MEKPGKCYYHLGLDTAMVRERALHKKMAVPRLLAWQLY